MSTADAKCQKIRHNTIQAAEKAAVKLRSRDAERGIDGHVRVYECPRCSGFHLTSMREERYFQETYRDKFRLVMGRRLG